MKENGDCGILAFDCRESVVKTTSESEMCSMTPLRETKEDVSLHQTVR